jgi:hypothetical protein
MNQPYAGFRRLRRWHMAVAVRVALLLCLALAGYLLATQYVGAPAIHWLHVPARTGQGTRGLEVTEERPGAWRVVMELDEFSEAEDHAGVIFDLPRAGDFSATPHLVLDLENCGDREVVCEPHLCDSSGFALTDAQWTERPQIALPPRSRVRWCTPPEFAYGVEGVGQVRLFFRRPPGEHTVVIHGIGFAGEGVPGVPGVGPGPKAEEEGEERRTVRLRLDAAWEELPAGQRKLLEDLERRHVAFFLHHRNRQTSLVPDRAPPWKGRPVQDRHRVCSVAGQGFALACWVLAERRGWLPEGRAAEWGEQALRVLLERTPHRKGVLPHFVDVATGAPVGNTEYSALDTALLIAGGLVLEGHAPGTPAAALSRRLRTRVAWPELLVPAGDGQALAHGLDEGGRFLGHSYGGYDEALLLYVLAAGSEGPAIPGEVFAELARRFPPTRLASGELAGKSLPLFVHHYPACFWGRLPGTRLPGGCEPYAASVRATLWNRGFCRAEGEETFRRSFWGVSSCDTPDGYRALAPVAGRTRGVCCPGVVLSGAPFLLRTIACDLEMWSATDAWPRILGDLGFVDSFSVREGALRINEDALAITVGSAALGLAEAQDGVISERFLTAPDVRRGMRACGFQGPTTKEGEQP